MCAFVHVCMHYSCVHAFIHVCIHVYVHSCMCAYVRVHALFMCACLHPRVHSCVYIHACVHSFMYACLHPHVHAFMHTRVLLCALILSCVHAFLPLPCSRAGPGCGLVNSTDSAPALPELTFWKEMDPELADRKLRGRGELRRWGLGSSVVGPC